MRAADASSGHALELKHSLALNEPSAVEYARDSIQLFGAE
jgi:hypothetical protein